MKLTHSDIAEIIRLVDASTLDEIVIEVGGLRVEARRRARGQPAAAAGASAAPATAMPEPARVAADPSAAERDLEPGQVAVTSPMVGTFYRRPAPESPPFVEVGARVAEGDALCMVEVMKLFTTIRAPCAGTVRRICVDDAAMVEYGQLMLVIDPA